MNEALNEASKRIPKNKFLESLARSLEEVTFHHHSCLVTGASCFKSKMSESEESSSDGDYYGPALPPNFKKVEEPSVFETQSRGPIIGPSLPQRFKVEENEVKLLSSSSSSPNPTTSKPEESKPVVVQIGPALPPEMRMRIEDARNRRSANNVPLPVESEEDSSSSDSDLIGPLPPDHPKALGQGTRNDKSIRPNKPAKKLQREEWMLIPPRNKSVTELGLGPRKFLTRAPAEPVMEGEDIDSDEEFERRTRAAMDQQIIDDYDKTMEAMKDKVDGGGKRKVDSLLEIHQRELKKKKEEAPENKERRPFDRDVDLQVSGLSGDDRQKYIEKSRELDTRFKQGRQKFL